MTKILSIRFGNHVPKLKVGKQNLEVFRSSDGAHLISSKTVNKALGYDGKNKNWPFEFLMHLNQLTPVDPVLLESLSRQLVANNDGQLVPVILAPDLISLCKAISKANLNGYLFVSEQKFAKSAAEILKDMASIDIKKAIDFITGYDRFKLNHKVLISRKMQEVTEASYPVWVKTLPDDFFEIILAFQNDDWEDLTREVDKYALLLNEMIFSRVDDDIFDLLELSKPKMRYSKSFEIEQYKIEPSLHSYIIEVAALLRASSLNVSIFTQMLDKKFPKRRDFKSVFSNSGQIQDINKDLISENLHIALSKRK